MDHQTEQPRVISGVEPAHRIGQDLGQSEHGKRCPRQYRHAFSEDVPKFRMILRPVVIAHNGGAAQRIPHEYGREDESEIQNRPEGSNPVPADEPHQLPVVQNVDHGAGHHGQEFRRAVAAGLQQKLQMEPDPARREETQQAGVPAGEVDQRQNAAETFADRGSQRRPRGTPGKHPHKQPVQDHVRHTGENRQNESEPWFLRRITETLEGHLQCEERRGAQIDPGVDDTGVVHGIVRPHPPGDGRKKDLTDQHQQGHNEIHCGEGRLPRKIQDKKTVHNIVDGRKYHGDDRRHHITEQFPVREPLMLKSSYYQAFCLSCVSHL